MNKRPGWSPKQIKVSVIACRNAGIDDNQRHLLLYQLGGRAIVDGVATSRSPRLKQPDFEKFMMLIEGYSNGRVGNYKPGYWERQFREGPYGRLLDRAYKLSHALQDAGLLPAGVISKAISRKYDVMANLDQDELHKAIDAMTAVFKRLETA